MTYFNREIAFSSPNTFIQLFQRRLDIGSEFFVLPFFIVKVVSAFALK